MLAKHNEGYNMHTSCSSQEKIPICRPIFFQACYNKHTHFLFGLIRKQNKNKKQNKKRKNKEKQKKKKKKKPENATMFSKIQSCWTIPKYLWHCQLTYLKRNRVINKPYREE